MIGTDATTGRHLSGIDHLKQSVADILTTPLGSRVMRRDYGSRLCELVDRPVNAAFYVQLYAATVDALDKWEPRIEVTAVSAAQDAAGRVTVTVEGKYLADGRPIKLEGIVI